MMINELEQRLIEAGDETHRHCIGVEGITRILLSNREGYSEEDIKRIQTAARYHDVGKSEIDKDILYSNRRLSDEEFKTYSIPYIKDMPDFIKQKWDFVSTLAKGRISKFSDISQKKRR